MRVDSVSMAFAPWTSHPRPFARRGSHCVRETASWAQDAGLGPNEISAPKISNRGFLKNLSLTPSAAPSTPVTAQYEVQYKYGVPRRYQRERAPVR